MSRDLPVINNNWILIFVHFDLFTADAMASDEDAPNAVLGRKEVEIPRCPVHSVVVYPDRAEVGCTMLSSRCARERETGSVSIYRALCTYQC